jgi:glycosyltransferase involved in cell wall biosynthesis
VSDPRPACLITATVTPYRVEPFALLAREEGVEVIAFRDPVLDPTISTASPRSAGVAGPGASKPADLVVRRTTERGAIRLAASGRYRTVICGLGGRLALPGAFSAARLRGVPFVLWASIWSHPHTPAHALSYLPTRALYRRADAVVTYGPHVSAYVARPRGSRATVFEAPQAVSAARFGARVPERSLAAARRRLSAAEDGFAALFVGRLEREKGIEVLLDAWRAGHAGPEATLSFAGTGPLGALIEAHGHGRLGFVPPAELVPLYAAADALVMPSIQTATFTEPWGLVANEAMHQGTPVIASDAVGAVAGGLVRHDRNGLVAPQGDVPALGAQLRRLAGDHALRARLGVAARADVARFSFDAWVEGVRRALAAVGASRGR